MFCKATCLAIISALAWWSPLFAACVPGSISTDAQLTFGEVRLCSSNGESDRVDFQLTGPAENSKALVLTNERGEILAVIDGTSYDFEGLPRGKCRVYGLNYEGELLAPIGRPLYQARFSSECAELSRSFVRIKRETPFAGTIQDQAGNIAVDVCLSDNSPDFVGFSLKGESGAQAYAYLITDERGIIEHVNFRGYFNFQYHEPGVRRVYGVAYDGALLARPGMSINDAIAAGCYDVTEGFLRVDCLLTEVGSISAEGSEHVRLRADSEAILRIERDGPPQENVVYVVIEQQTSLIKAISDSPLVDFRCLDAGRYLVLAYSYTGTILLEVGDPLWGGGRFASSCFNPGDNGIVVRKDSAADCPEEDPCLAEAGGIRTQTPELELNDGSARLTATLDGSRVIPENYESIFLLTQGANRRVVAISPSTPSFRVSQAGTYGIHVLVAELTDRTSDNHVRIDQLAVGRETLNEFQERILSAGVCADLTIPGAVFSVTDPGAFECTAFAGSLTAEAIRLELEDGEVLLEATPDGKAVIPADFEIRYLLTSGFSFTLEQIGEEPSFIVDRAGDFSILTYVGEFSDASSDQYVDLSGVEFGTTTATDLIAEAFDQDLCVDLDFFGTSYQVVSTKECDAVAGTLTPEAAEITLEPGGSVRIRATDNGDAVLPRNFERTFLLTDEPSGTILAFSARPNFLITQAGRYAIRSWVGEFNNRSSRDYIDFAIIRTGLTPLSEITALIEGSERCSAVDLAGAQFNVTLASLTRVGGTFNLDVLPESVVVTATPSDGAYDNEQLYGVNAVLLDARGVPVSYSNTELLSGTTVKLFNRDNLPGGMYFVRMVSGGSTTTVPLVLP